jgi:hypothetical protein
VQINCLPKSCALPAQYNGLYRGKALPQENFKENSWIKRHTGITGNELAHMYANPSSCALQLVLISQTHFQAIIKGSYYIFPKYINSEIVNCDFLKLICNFVNKKSTDKIKKIKH